MGKGRNGAGREDEGTEEGEKRIRNREGEESREEQEREERGRAFCHLLLYNLTIN